MLFQRTRNFNYSFKAHIIHTQITNNFKKKYYFKIHFKKKKTVHKNGNFRILYSIQTGAEQFGNAFFVSKVENVNKYPKTNTKKYQGNDEAKAKARAEHIWQNVKKGFLQKNSQYLQKSLWEHVRLFIENEVSWVLFGF